ncbi:MAG TPA: dihydropteroate synthase, partial [Thermoanaerobaculia bacterium]
VVGEVRAELADALARAVSAGIDESQVVLDPGIGFGKTREQNLALIARLDELSALGRPLLLGASRKSFISKGLPSERLGGSLAAVAWAARSAAIVRVHDVAETVQLLDVWEALEASAQPTLKEVLPA